VRFDFSSLCAALTKLPSSASAPPLAIGTGSKLTAQLKEVRQLLVIEAEPREQAELFDRFSLDDAPDFFVSQPGTSRGTFLPPT
jgi:hypothetical protein